MHGLKSRRLIQTAAALSVALIAAPVLAQSHPAVPALSSKPGAEYTVYLDFAGFDFTGTWGSASGASPGDLTAYQNVTTSFSASQQTSIDQIWAHVAEKYSAFNVNVTTVNPAVAAGDASTDADRQAYYDKTAHMMHTIIAGTDSSYDDGGEGGVSYVGVTKNSYSTSGNSGASYGLHTNFVFTEGVGTGQQIVGEAASHENGHGFGLNHQADYIGTTEESGYSSNNNNEGTGSFAPTMGVSYYSQRGLWRLGTYEGGGGATQNDVQVIENNPSMGAYTDDGIGNTMTAASLLPIGGSTVNDIFAKGIIVPASTTAANPVGSANYTADYFKFNSSGASVSLTVHDGAERIAFGTADPGETLNSVLTIYNSSGGSVATAATNFSTATETITQTLPAGTYYAEVSAAGNDHSTFDTPSDYYGMGSFFITGTGVTGGLSTDLYWAGGAATTKWNQLASGATNWRTDATGATDPGQTPSADVNVYLTTNSGTNGTMTLGTSTSINSLTFTGTGTTGATTGAAIAADGSTLTILAVTSNSSYITTGLSVLAGAAANSIAVPVVLGNSQTWAISNSASNPLTVTGVISDGGNSYGIAKTGAGTLVLTAANTFDGNSSVTGGIILLKNQLALQDTTITASGGTLNFDSSVSAYTLGGLAGTSNIALQNNATTPAAIALSVGNDGDSTTDSGILSGGGSLNIIGGGSLDLTGVNTYTGNLTITKGSATLENNQSAANGSILLPSDSSADSGSLTILSGASVAVASGKTFLIGDITGSFHGNETVTSAGTVNNAGTLSLGRAGTLTLTGGTWNQSGSMVLDAIGGYGDSMNVSTGATFNYTSSSPVSFIDGGSGATSVLTINGGTFNTAAALRLTTHNTGSDSVNLQAGGTLGILANIPDLFTTASATPITFTLGTGGGTINTNTFTLTITDNIGGAGSLTKSGTGLLTLPNANTYTGGTTIASGPLLVENGAALGTGMITINIGSTSTSSLQLSGGITITNTFGGFASEVGSGTPTIESLSGNNTVTQPMSITSTGGNGAIFQSDAGLLTLSGGLTTTLTSSRGYYLQGAGNGIETGNITDSGSNILFVNKSGTGTWTLTGTNTYADGTTVAAGTLQIGNGGTTGNFGLSYMTIAGGATVAFNRSDSPTYSNSVSLSGGIATINVLATPTTLTGVISGSGALTLAAGTLNITNNETYTGTTTANAGTTLNVKGILSASSAVTSSGTVNFAANNSSGSVFTRTDGALTINAAGNINIAPAWPESTRTLLVTPGLTIAGATGAWTGRLDVANNELDIKNGNLTNLTDQITQGFHTGTWTGTEGITSTTAAADSTHLTAIGVILNSAAGSPIYGSGTTLGLFDGANPAVTDVLVKYTYYGDANLDGAVDGSDYSLIDNGFNNQLTGWYNGDFNYDGVVDGSDYTLIDNAFNTQGTSLGTNPTNLIAEETSQIAAGSSSVPEPACLGMVALVSLTLARRRRV